MIPFSQRHKDLIKKNKLCVYLNVNQKTKIFYHLSEYNEFFDEYTETNWHYQESTFEKVKRDLLKAYGYKELKSFKENEFIVVDTIEEFLLGTKAENVLDAIELFYSYISFDERKRSFVIGINELLKNEEVPVRFLEGEFVRLDSDFAESEILIKAHDLLKINEFSKALDDFKDARNRLSKGDFDGCIFCANNSLESLLKKILDKNSDNQGTLKKSLLSLKLLPEYFGGFSENFAGLLQSAFTIANKSSRHGKKEKPDEINLVDEAIANFCMNLSGSLIIFIIERYIEKNHLLNKRENNHENEIIEEDDLPL